MGVIDNLEVITEMSRAIVWGGDLFFVRFGQLLGEVIIVKKGFLQKVFRFIRLFMSKRSYSKQYDSSTCTLKTNEYYPAALYTCGH